MNKAILFVIFLDAFFVVVVWFLYFYFLKFSFFCTKLAVVPRVGWFSASKVAHGWMPGSLLILCTFYMLEAWAMTAAHSNEARHIELTAGEAVGRDEGLGQQ